MATTENNNDNSSKKNIGTAVQNQSIHQSMSAIKHKFIFISSQGGVGKTSVIVKLAMALSKKGLKTGLMDLNFHNPNVHRMLNLSPPEVTRASNNQLEPMVYSDNLKMASIKSLMHGMDETGGWGELLEISEILRFSSSINWDELDYLFIDTPPGPGERLLSVIGFIPDAKVIIVTAPDKISDNNAKKIINFFRKEEISIFGWINNMRGFLCQNCGERIDLLNTGPVNRAIFLNEIPFLGRIPIDCALLDSTNTINFFPKIHEDSETSVPYSLIANKILQRCS